MTIEYALEANLSASEFLDLLARSGLAERRPVEQRAIIEAMLRNATLILTARHNAKLLGVARALSDGAYCTYLSDLAVDVAWQRQGIGKQLLQRIHAAAGLQTNLILLAAPKARSYYGHIGMEPHPSCWVTYGRSMPADSVAEMATAQTYAASIATKSAATIAADATPNPAASQRASVGQFFDSIVDDYATAIHRCFPRYSEMLWAVMEYLPALPPAPRILELGCGTGNLSVLLAERFPQASMTLVDLSAESLAACRRRVGSEERLTYLVQDMRELEFEKSQFDLIVSTIAIHHLTSEEKQQLFRRSHHWLRSGGLLTYSDQFAAATPELYQQHLQQWERISREAGATTEEWAMWMEHQREHDHHDALLDQLSWLNAAGFQRCDCCWRYLLWTVVQAYKP